MEWTGEQIAEYASHIQKNPWHSQIYLSAPEGPIPVSEPKQRLEYMMKILHKQVDEKAFSRLRHAGNVAGLLHLEEIAYGIFISGKK